MKFDFSSASNAEHIQSKFLEKFSVALPKPEYRSPIPMVWAYSFDLGNLSAEQKIWIEGFLAALSK